MKLPTRLALTLASAVLAIVSFPPLHWWCLALIAWLPFFLALRGAGPRTALLIGLLHGMLLFGGTLIWLVEIFGPMAFLLHFILAMFSVLFAGFFNAFDRKDTSAWKLTFITATLWTGIEFFRSEWFGLRFPWITPGTALPPNQLTPWIGVYGISFLVVLANMQLLLDSGAKKVSAGAGMIALGIIIFIPSGNPDAEPTATVAAVQGETLSFQQYLDLSDSITPPIDAIIWPEYALNFDLRKDDGKLAAVRQLMTDKQAEVFVVGSKTEHADGSWSNTAIIVGPDTILGSHDKNRPVHFFNDGIAGTDAPAWPTPIGTIATPICFDNDYATIPRKAVTNGAELLLVPSMDAEYWTARQHLQHAELFRHRAAENGRWVVVAASSGLTQAISPTGNRIHSLPLFEPGVLIAEVTLQSALTPYTRIGWMIGPLCTVIAAILTVVAVIRARREAKTKREPRVD